MKLLLSLSRLPRLGALTTRAPFIRLTNTRLINTRLANISFANTRFVSIGLATLGLATLSGSALAQAHPMTLPHVVVSAGHIAQDASEVYQGVSVITREQLDRLQATNLVQVLQTLPGVAISQSGGKGSLSGFFIRGTVAAQTLVLIDGVRAASAGSGAAALETLSVDQIERIEVIRGARSSQYGADAIGGVIQIFTRQATQDGVALRGKIAYGNWDTWERSLGASFQNSRSQASINLSSDAMTGHDRSRSPLLVNQDDDAFRNHAVSLNVSHKVTSDLKLSLSHLQQKGESEYDYGWAGGYPYDEFALRNTRAMLDWAVSDSWSTRVELGLNHNDNINRYDDVADHSFFKTERHQVQWLNTLDLAAQQLQLGVDTYREQLHGSTAFAVNERTNEAVFAQYRLKGASSSAEIGLRVDDNNIYGDFTSFNLGAGVSVTPSANLFATYSEAFRAPTFSELYYPNYDNPHLQPEESNNLELKFTQAFSDTARLSASVYYTQIEQAIINNEQWIPQNIGEVEIQGAEIEWSQQFNLWHLSANASHVDARDQHTGHALNRRPKKTLNVDLSRTLGDLQLGASIYGAGASWDNAAAGRKMAGYALLNLRAAYQLSANLSAGLKIDNLLDKTYSTALTADGVWPDSFYTGYNEMGRTALVSLSWTPKL